MPGTEDILGALLSSQMGAGESDDGYDPGGVGALKAYQGSPFLQGEASHAGPLGQISQALMPLIAAKIYEGQAGRQQQAEKVKTLVSVLTLVRELKGADLQDAKTRAELKKLGIEEKFLSHFADLHGAVNGDGIPAGTRLNVGGLSMPLGPEKPVNSEIGLLREANPSATAGELLSKLNVQKDEASQRISDRTAERLEASRKSREVERQEAPLEKTAGIYAYDPLTAKRVSTAKVGDLESGKVLKLSGNDQRALTNVREAWRELNELESLSSELLPEKGGMFNTPITLARGSYKEHTGDPKWVKFDQLASFAKFPILQASVRGRPPLAESRTIREVNKADTRASALEKINEMRENMLGVMDSLGFDPGALSGSGQARLPEAATRSSQASPTPGKRPTTLELGNQIDGMRRLGYTSDRIKSVLTGLYGGDIDVDMK